jgi:SARP family transcriptional regulator, regulator of embCAB operon
MVMLKIKLFGGTEVRTDDGRVLGLRDFGGAKPREIFEILVLSRGRVLSKDALADLLWDGAPPEDGTATLESYVSVLRKKIAPGRSAKTNPIATVSGGYRFDAAQAQVDLDEVDALLSTAEQREPASALHLLRRALELARGEVLEHQPYARWAQSVRRSWQDRLARAAVRGAEAALQLGDPDRALLLARRALRADGLAEDAWRAVMRAHWAAGRRAEALRAYESCRERLADELGVDPAPQTKQLFQALLQTDAADGAGDGHGGPELNRAVAAVIDLVRRAHVHRPDWTEPIPPVDEAAALLVDLLRRAGVSLPGAGRAGRAERTSEA